MIYQIPRQKINLNKIVTGKDLDFSNYDKKFNTWDEIVKKGLIPENRHWLTDLSIFAYDTLYDDSGNHLKFTAYQDIISLCTHDFTPDNPNRYIIFKASNQIGKGIPEDEVLPTPNGFVKMKDLNPGDSVYDSQGIPTVITSIPYIGKLPVYNITFNDGSSIKVNKEHLWIAKSSMERFTKKYKKNDRVWDNPNYNKWNTYSTEEIINKGKYSPTTKPYKKFSIPLCKPVKYHKKELEIDPYVLGLILGDGCITNCCLFSTEDLEIINSIKKKYTINNKKFKNCYFGTIKNIKIILSNLKLLGCNSETKFIPPNYLLSSIEQRKELLKGLMDTDGSVYGKHSTLEYCTVSKELKDNFVELLNSLGCIVNKVTEKKPFYYDKNRKKIFGRLAYSIRFKSLFSPFKLKRKHDKWKPVTKYKHERIIEKIELCGKEVVKCISVDSKDSSYLVSNNYLVTHNSYFLISFAIQKAFFENNRNIIFVSKSVPQAQFLLTTIRQVLNNSEFSGTWRESVGDTANTTILTFTKNDGKIVNRIICAPAGEGLLGYPVHYLLLDEADFYEDGKKFFWKVAFPRLNKTKGQIILFSNPNPDIARSDSLLWELWSSNSDLIKRRFTFNFLDAPWNTKKEFDLVQGNSPSYIFQSTHCGEFPTDAGGFFKQSELDRNLVKEWVNELPIVDRPVYLGIDFGKARDNTVLALGYVTDDDPYQLHVRYTKEYDLGTDYQDIVKDIKSIVDYYKTNHHGVGGLAFDATGVGGAIKEMIEEQGLLHTSIVWSLQTKSKLYGDFKILMESKHPRIKIVYTDKCYRQMAGLVFKKTPRGYLTMENSKTSVHDDFPDAISLLIAVSIKPMTVTPGCTIL